MASTNKLRFDGDTYEASLDRERLANQLGRVRRLMSDSRWRTLLEISDATGDPQSSVSARLRDLRKPRFGSLIVNRRRRGEGRRGVFEYQLPERQMDWVDQLLTLDESVSQ